MKKNDVTKIMIETAVAKALRDMRTDPKRSVRNLVDLGCSFAGGRFQKSFFKLAQNLLKNRDSAYYVLAADLTAYVDAGTIQHFGVNLGYNSFTAGARRIREHEAAAGYNIPWSITFHLNAASAWTIEQADALIAEGNQLGVFTYAFLMEPPYTAPAPLFRLVENHTDCAFLLFLPPCLISEASIPSLSACTNALISVDTDQAGWKEAAAQLRQHRLLYAAHRHYTAETASAILSGEWAASAVGCGCAAAVCFAQTDCPYAVSSEVDAYIARERTAQRYPLFLMEYYADNLRIDTIISDEACFFGVLPDGRVTASGGAGETATVQTIGDASLRDLLARHCPKRAGSAQ